MAMKIGCILVPVDFSETSLHALAYAIDVAETTRAKVHVLHVCPLLVYALESGAVPDAPGFSEKLHAGLRAKLGDVAERVAARGLAVETSLVDGNPAHVIADVARSAGADLIVMATHGRKGFDHMMVGSVTERVVRMSPVPVLSVR